MFEESPENKQMEKLASTIREESQLFTNQPEQLLKLHMHSEECPLHEGYSVDSLCVDPGNDYPFKCIICLTDEGIRQSSLISLKQIARSTSTTVFANFPFNDQALTQQVKKVLQNPPIIESLKRDIDTYFKGLRASVNDKIDCIEAEMIVTAQSISEMSSEILILYNQMSQKDVMKGIIMDEENLFLDKSKEIKEFCSRILSKESENKQKMSAAIKKVIDIQEAINFETPERIKDEILQSIEKIDMFKSEKQIKHVVAVAEPNVMQNASNNFNQKVEQLIQFIKANLTNLNDESCKNLKEEFEKMVFALQNQKNPQADPINSSLSKLPENQVKIIQNFIKTLEQENNKGMIQEKQYPVNVKELLEILKGSKLIGVAEKFLQDIEIIFQKISGILGLFNTRESFEILEIDEKPPKPQQVFEKKQLLDRFHQSFKLPSNSQVFQILKEGELRIEAPGCKQSQCQTNVLSNTTGYKIKIAFKRPIGQLKLGSFRIGLIPSKYIDSDWVLSDCQYSGFNSSVNKGASIVVQGGKITSQQLRNGINSIEIRWCVAKKLFFVSDLKYTNINQVEQNFFNPRESYCFAIFFNQLAEIDCSIKVYDYQEIDPETLHKFI